MRCRLGPLHRNAIAEETGVEPVAPIDQMLDGGCVHNSTPGTVVRVEKRGPQQTNHPVANHQRSARVSLQAHASIECELHADRRATAGDGVVQARDTTPGGPALRALNGEPGTSAIIEWMDPVAEPQRFRPNGSPLGAFENGEIVFDAL